MIDNNVDQDEWFNLYLCLGSCWVNKSRYETRYDTRYDTWHKVRTWTKKSLDQLIELKLRITELNARSLDKVELKSIRLRTRILSQFQDHLLKKDQFVDNLFIIYRINQEPGSVCVRDRWDEPTRIFKSMFQVR
jgi:hypothetical protein